VLDHCPADVAMSQNLTCRISSTIMVMDPDDLNPASSGFVNKLILGLGMLDLSLGKAVATHVRRLKWNQ